MIDLKLSIFLKQAKEVAGRFDALHYYIYNTEQTNKTRLIEQILWEILPDPDLLLDWMGLWCMNLVCE